jgi:hypothetical protein
VSTQQEQKTAIDNALSKAEFDETANAIRQAMSRTHFGTTEYAGLQATLDAHYEAAGFSTERRIVAGGIMLSSTQASGQRSESPPSLLAGVGQRLAGLQK